MIFGGVLVLLGVLVIIYYVYRQSVDPGYNLFPSNHIDRDKKLHPENYLSRTEAAAERESAAKLAE